jgi:hypothetical protein
MTEEEERDQAAMIPAVRNGQLKCWQARFWYEGRTLAAGRYRTRYEASMAAFRAKRAIEARKSQVCP